MSVISEVKEELNPIYFIKDKLKIDFVELSKEYILKINDILYEMYGENASVSIEDSIFVGSHATYQYTSTSDADVNMKLNYNEDKLVDKDVLSYINDWIRKNLDEQVFYSHEKQAVQFRVNMVSVSDTYFLAYDGVYKIYSNIWLKKPCLKTTKKDYIAKVVNLGINENVSFCIFEDTEQFKYLYDQLISKEAFLNSDDLSFLKSKAQELIKLLNEITSKRRTAFSQTKKYMESNNLISLNWTQTNIIFKKSIYIHLKQIKQLINLVNEWDNLHLSIKKERFKDIFKIEVK